MKVFNFSKTKPADTIDSISDFSQLQWVDFSRAENVSIGELEDILHVKHRSDLMNSKHPPYYEQTDDYEMLIFRTLDKRYDISNPQTRSIAFLICENTVITVHDEDDDTLSGLCARWSNKKSKRITDLLTLVHLICDEIVEGFLNIMEPLHTMASEWQQRLLDPEDPFNDWNVIMQSRSRLRGLNTIMEMQRDVLLSWREQTHYEFTASHTIKFNDLNDHLGRVTRLADGLSADLDSLTQIYFASTSQLTNRNVQILAVISAIFLPLNLIAGIFGMNFESIPMLDHPLGPYVIVFIMLFITFMLLWWFKKKKWY